MPEITRFDFVQGESRTIEFHARAMHPTGGATALASLGAATAYLRMRHPSGVVATAVGTIANASLGQVLIPAGTAFLASPGQWRAQLTIDRGAAGLVTVPADEPYLVVIRERV